MSIETKVIHFDYADYLSFGYKLDEDKSNFSHSEYVLFRDDKIKNRTKLIELENKYEELKTKFKMYTPTNPARCICAFLFFIVPGVLYVTNKHKQKHKVEDFNSDVQKEIDEVLKTAKSLL